MEMIRQSRSMSRRHHSPRKLIRGSNFAQKFKVLGIASNGRERRPRRCEPNATRFVSNGCREREILQSVRQVKQAKKMMLTVQSVQADVAGSYRPYDDVVVVHTDRTMTWLVC
jgi:hypothetical protein